MGEIQSIELSNQTINFIITFSDEIYDHQKYFTIRMSFINDIFISSMCYLLIFFITTCSCFLLKLLPLIYPNFNLRLIQFSASQPYLLLSLCSQN